jgi:hypothetical protein
LQILYKVNASTLLYLKDRSYMWCAQSQPWVVGHIMPNNTLLSFEAM